MVVQCSSQSCNQKQRVSLVDLLPLKMHLSTCMLGTRLNEKKIQFFQRLESVTAYKCMPKSKENPDCNMNFSLSEMCGPRESLLASCSI